MHTFNKRSSAWARLAHIPVSSARGEEKQAASLLIADLGMDTVQWLCLSRDLFLVWLVAVPVNLAAVTF